MEHNMLQNLSVVELTKLIENAKSILDEKLNIAASILGISSKKLSSHFFQEEVQSETLQVESNEVSDESKTTILFPDCNLIQHDTEETKLPVIITEGDEVLTVEEAKVPKDEEIKPESDQRFYPETNKADEIELPILTKLSRKALEVRQKDEKIPKSPIILNSFRIGAWIFNWQPQKKIIRTGNKYPNRPKEYEYGRIVSSLGLMPTIMKGGAAKVLICRNPLRQHAVT